MNQIYWCIRQVREAKDIEEAAELLSGGWVIIARLKHNDRPDSFVCATDKERERRCSYPIRKSLKASGTS